MQALHSARSPGGNGNSAAVDATLTNTRGPGSHSMLQDYPQKCHYVLSLVTIMMLGASTGAVLLTGVQALSKAGNAPPSTGAIGTRCFKTAWKQGSEERSVTSSGVLIRGSQIDQRYVFTFGADTADFDRENLLRCIAAPDDCQGERPVFIEEACGEETSSGATPALRKWAFVATLLACTMLVVASFGAYFWVFTPLQKLTKILVEFRTCHIRDANGLASNANGHVSNLTGSPSWISEVYKLQKAVVTLMHSMDAFSSFLPLKLARKMAFGDEQCSVSHVVCRDVTIMFSSVKDVARLSATLPHQDLLHIMTRYLSVMTSIVKMYEGTVAEMQGDSLLVLWNTPAGVEDHAAKACTAVLAMQQALALLNPQLETQGLPGLAMSVGLHSGPIVRGVPGSRTTMRMGCLEDSVNLTGQLEGLCKYYGVGTVCSMNVFHSLKPDSGFLMRRLDTVQVKGRSTPTGIYELVCRDAEDIVGVGNFPGGAQLGLLRERARLYERALDAFQARQFPQARELAEQVLQNHPEDLAADQLLKRIESCLDEHGDVRISTPDIEGWTGILVMGEK